MGRRGVVFGVGIVNSLDAPRNFGLRMRHGSRTVARRVLTLLAKTHLFGQAGHSTARACAGGGDQHRSHHHFYTNRSLAMISVGSIPRNARMSKPADGALDSCWSSACVPVVLGSSARRVGSVICGWTAVACLGAEQELPWYCSSDVAARPTS